ncbi:MAG: hypothetical protein IK081_04310 [Lachnospiraceae bacterium]|nr:hypothetical protein [Lachnospiraceae bacterium]
MRKEYARRVRKAMEYQKKAVMTLLPESMEGHLEVIGGEVRKMMLELAVEAFRDCKESDLCKELFGCGGIKDEITGSEKNDKESKVKKVNIS